MEYLKFPEHYPPTDRWKKFFIGVRWLGPDLSFFKDLKAMQARRDQKSMAEWGGGKRQAVAERIAGILSFQLGWKSNVFLPGDIAEVAFNGPAFDFIDSDRAFEEVVEMLKTIFGINPSQSFWEDKGKFSMGELVDVLLNEFTSPVKT